METLRERMLDAAIEDNDREFYDYVMRASWKALHRRSLSWGGELY
jgi:hypothetical protein